MLKHCVLGMFEAPSRCGVIQHVDARDEPVKFVAVGDDATLPALKIGSKLPARAGATRSPLASVMQSGRARRKARHRRSGGQQQVRFVEDADDRSPSSTGNCETSYSRMRE